MGLAVTEEVLDARTPAEAKRHWMIDRLWWISRFCFVALAFLIGFVAFGAWPAAIAGQRLSVLAGLGWGLLAILTFIVWTFAIGGPVGRWEGRWGNRSIGAYGDEDRARDAYDGGTPK